MSNKHINQLFEALAPESEQRDKMFQGIMEQSRNENANRQRADRMAPVKRFKPAVLVAVLLVCLTTTAFAAAYMGLDETFLKFLKPVNLEQAEYLSNGAYVVNKRVVQKNGTIEVKQVIGDGNLTYILMDFIAPEGTVLDAARYRFEFPTVDTDQSFHSVDFTSLDDGNPNDNKISLMMSIMTEHSIAGQTARFEFQDLQAADPFPGVFETVIPGKWETAFKLDFKEYSTLYPIHEDITMYGYSAVLQSVSVSPISIALKIESESFKEIGEAAGGLKEVGLNVHLDNYPITIHYKDGSSETTSIFNGMHLVNNTVNQMLTIKTFEKVINDKEIASIVFFDKEIPIRN